MAVDTAQRRRSMISFGDALYGERVPEATDFDSGTDRYAAVFLYDGINPAVAPDTGNSSRRQVATFIKRNADFVNRRVGG